MSVDENVTQDDQQAQDIAKGLTKAQRDWLRDHKVSEKWLTAHGIEHTPAMEKCGYTPKWGGHNHYRLTPLGLQVRAILQEQGNG